MEDFPLLILFFIVYLIASSSGKKKKKKSSARANSGFMRTRSRGEQRDMREPEEDRRAMAGFQTAFAVDSSKRGQNCEEERIHLHDASQMKMNEAAEGEDPCHFGGEQEETAEAGALWSETDEAQEVLGQDVLRGIIMSEILMRPQERRALQRSKREYHGY